MVYIDGKKKEVGTIKPFRSPFAAGGGGSLASTSSNTPIDPDYSWVHLVMTWDSVPSINSEITGGKVYNYTFQGTLRYRFVPSPYVPLQDAFYAAFKSGALSEKIVARGGSIE